ncbi:glucosyl-3-phosphoglycerate synthase [soil metagenome]
MHLSARRWFDSHTFEATDFALPDLLAAKATSGTTVSVVIPARNEAATVGTVVGRISDALVATGMVDELVVIDSDSTDDTAALAAAAGAKVFASAAVDTGLKSLPGKGEALWRSLFVTSGDIVAFIDADLTEWGAHFVTGLLGPLLTNDKTLLVRGFYDRLFASAGGPYATGEAHQGGRVTELVARPLLNLHWPALTGVVQPLAGECAMRRSLAESLPFPVGYGVEFATLVDTAWRHGLGAISQVDLGQRGHSHQNVHDLGVMATEILSTATRRMNRSQLPAPVGLSSAWTELNQYDRNTPGHWRARSVPIAERPPAVSLDAYHRGRGA